MNELVSPIAKSVFLCEDVELDELSGKPSVRGLLNSKELDFVPNSFSVIDELCVFAEFVGGVARELVRVEISNARNDTVIFRSPDRVVRFPGRHTTMAINFRVIDLAIPEPGVYIVEVYCNDNFVDDRLLRITASKEDES